MIQPPPTSTLFPYTTLFRSSIVHGKFTLGADASAAAGPVGRSATASTDAQLKAEIYSYSRARGLFAGAALDRKSTRLNSSHMSISYAVFCLKKKKEDLGGCV